MPVAKYGERVPVSILRRATQIRKVFPDAEFFVEQLLVGDAKLELDDQIWTAKHEFPIVDPEPFLRVRRGTSDVYVGVWAEPEFEHEVK